MKTASAKAKGRGLQNKVRDKILALFTHLDSDDVKSCPMGSNGEDIILSKVGRQSIPFTIECKKNKAFAVYNHYDQALKQNLGNPLVIIEADRRKPLAILDLDVLLSMLKELDDKSNAQ